ncbi:MAG: efflux RND transporter permease subunit [Syntrophorhabdaceae bacterium]
MLSKFFLDRPVFAWVIAIIIMLVGTLAIYSLPISQYPPIAPPSIYIASSYPGASAETVENSVTQIIEQKLTGLDNMIYLSSTSDSSGSSRITLTFSPGTDADLAWSKVQNKLQLAMTSLPEAVQRQGVTVGKATRNWLMIIGLISEDKSMDGNDLRDYAQSNLEKVIARIPGVGEVENFGSQYAMRIWFDPTKLTNYSLTVANVTEALRTYNVEVSAGQFGGTPAIPGQRLNTSIIVQGMLKTTEEFASIPVRVNPDGSVVRIKDIGRVELGTDSYDIESFYNGSPSAAMGIRMAAGANALDTADAVKSKLAEMSKFFPKGLKVVYPYDTTPFVRVAISEVVETLLEAILLVFLIMWLFMGSIRATLIPTIAVPIVILGTFAVLQFFGFSINMLTMFAMVLSIGLLVDDAIVVVENVERIMREEGLPPKEATAKSMTQITSALVGIGLVLSAVFGPMAFFGGSTGVIYRQFSVTIIASMLLSVLVALVLTPVLCATILKPIPKGHDSADSAFPILRPFFRWFDRKFFKTRDKYVSIVSNSFGKRKWYFAGYLVIAGLAAFTLLHMPTSYVPDEDQGIMLAQVMMPTGSTIEQTKEVVSKLETYFQDKEKEAAESVMTISGVGFSGRTQTNGMVFVKLKDWKLRGSSRLKVKAVAERASREFFQLRNALVFAFPPPAVIELGQATGFDFMLLDRGGLGHQKLMESRNQLLGIISKDKRLTKVRPNGMEDIPEYRVDVDWEKAGALGVPISSIHNTISTAFGSAYVNNFVQGGRVKRVFVQADAPHRMLPKDIDKLYVRNNSGKMVQFSAFATSHWSAGSPRLERYNGFPALNLWGEPARGVSSGEAMKAMEEAVAKLPPGVGYEWTGLSYQEKMSSSQAPVLYAFSVIVIFLCVAALYESWPIPIANLLMLPLGIFGATLATWSRSFFNQKMSQLFPGFIAHGMNNDVYFQIGFLTTLGLTTKNAILIIQFARERMANGEGLIDATLGAVRTRLRPVIMTSLAFFFGVLPLALSGGAGAGAMSAIGTAVAGGMLSATFIDLFYIPLLFVAVTEFFSRKDKKVLPQNPDPPDSVEVH